MGVQSHATTALTPRKTRYPHRKLDGPQGRCGQEWKNSTPPGFDPRTVQQIARCHNEYSINYNQCFQLFNTLKPNDHYRGRTAPLTSKRCSLYIYSTNIGTEFFKHGVYSLFFSSKCSLFHNSNVFGSCIIYILFIPIRIEPHR